jgi:hypothetical protein
MRPNNDALMRIYVDAYCPCHQDGAAPPGRPDDVLIPHHPAYPTMERPMTESAHEHTDNARRRRTVIAGALASIAAAATVAVPARASTGQDAGLLAACARFDRLAHRRRLVDDLVVECTDDEVSELLDQYHTTVNTVARMPARTPQGIAAKAMVLALFVCEDDPSDPVVIRLARATVADVRRGAAA